MPSPSSPSACVSELPRPAPSSAPGTCHGCLGRGGHWVSSAVIGRTSRDVAWSPETAAGPREFSWVLAAWPRTLLPRGMVAEERVHCSQSPCLLHGAHLPGSGAPPLGSAPLLGGRVPQGRLSLPPHQGGLDTNPVHSAQPGQCPAVPRVSLAGS